MNNNSTFHTLRRRLFMPAIFIVTVALLVVFLLSVSPSSSSFIVSFIPLLLVWLGVYSGIMSLRFIVKIASGSTFHTLAATIATLIMLLLMFSALGQVSFFDISLLLSLAILGVFYFRRSWPK